MQVLLSYPAWPQTSSSLKIRELELLEAGEMNEAGLPQVFRGF